MRFIYCLAALCLMSHSNLQNEAVSELKAIIEVYNAQLEYELELSIEIYDQNGKNIQQHSLKTAKDGNINYADFGRLVSYTGGSGQFLVNPSAKEVYYTSTSTQTSSVSTVPQLEKLLLDSTVQLSLEQLDASRNQITARMTKTAEDPYKYQLIYNRHNKKVLQVRLFSKNITQTDQNPITGHMTISYTQKPLELKISTMYELFLEHLKNQQPSVSEGHYAGYTIKI